MYHKSELTGWWDLHLRKARGEVLSDDEQRRYDAELSRQDHQSESNAPDLESLRRMRERVLALMWTNAELENRLTQLTA